MLEGKTEANQAGRRSRVQGSWGSQRGVRAGKLPLLTKVEVSITNSWGETRGTGRLKRPFGKSAMEVGRARTE